MSELTQRILQMAENGVYRESIFDVFQPFATKKDVRQAIAYAKSFGLHSVAALRDSTLGTYYQLDSQAYEAQKHKLKCIPAWEDERQQRQAKPEPPGETIRDMLTTAWAFSGLLVILSGSLWLVGLGRLAGFGLCAAAGAAAAWQLQRRLVQRHLAESLGVVSKARGQAPSLRQ
ncbi:MAG: hypothetical protein AAF289_08920 [Cyanobacteria bacterium P01_A01_bin.135]